MQDILVMFNIKIFVGPTSNSKSFHKDKRSWNTHDHELDMSVSLKINLIVWLDSS